MYNSPLNPPTKLEGLRLVSGLPSNKLIESVQPKNFPDVFTSNWPLLQVLKEDKAIDFLAGAIAKRVEQLSPAHPMDGVAVRLAARYIYDDFSILNLADVQLCLTMGVKGEWGDYYGRLNIQVIYDWFNHYYSDRTNAKRFYDLHHEA